jgi:hypothetical protein
VGVDRPDNFKTNTHTLTYLYTHDIYWLDMFQLELGYKRVIHLKPRDCWENYPMSLEDNI